jgi:hypothetical protein
VQRDAAQWEPRWRRTEPLDLGQLLTDKPIYRQQHSACFDSDGFRDSTDECSSRSPPPVPPLTSACEETDQWCNLAVKLGTRMRLSSSIRWVTRPGAANGELAWD